MKDELIKQLKAYKASLKDQAPAETAKRKNPDYVTEMTLDGFLEFLDGPQDQEGEA